MGRILTYLLAYGGAFVSLFYPYIGLLIYVCFAILSPESLWFWEFPAGAGGGFSYVVALALLAGWAFQSFGKWEFGRASPIVWSITFLFFWAAYSWPLSQDRDIAQKWVVSFFKIVLPFVVGMTLIDNVAKLKQLAWVMVCTEGYVAFEMNMSYLKGVNRVVLEGFGGMDNNSMAIGMVTGVGLAFFLGLGAKNIFFKLIAFGSSLMMAHVVLFSFSRGGMVALAITGIVGFLITPRKPLHTALFAASVLIILSLSGKEVRDRFITVFAEKEERDKSAETRLNLWRDNIDVMLKHPVFGVGPHQWPVVAPEYGYTENKEGHSLWLQTGAELGVPGFVALLSFYLICIARLWPYTSEHSIVPDPFFHDAARMVVASLVGFSVAAQFVSITFLEIPYYAVLLGAGVLKLMSVPQAQLHHDPYSTEFEAETWESHPVAARSS